MSKIGKYIILSISGFIALFSAQFVKANCTPQTFGGVTYYNQ